MCNQLKATGCIRLALMSQPAPAFAIFSACGELRQRCVSLITFCYGWDLFKAGHFEKICMDQIDMTREGSSTYTTCTTQNFSEINEAQPSTRDADNWEKGVLSPLCHSIEACIAQHISSQCGCMLHCILSAMACWMWHSANNTRPPPWRLSAQTQGLLLLTTTTITRFRK